MISRDEMQKKLNPSPPIVTGLFRVVNEADDTWATPRIFKHVEEAYDWAKKQKELTNFYIVEVACIVRNVGTPEKSEK